MKKFFLFLFISLVISNNSTNPTRVEWIKKFFSNSESELNTKLIFEYFFNKCENCQKYRTTFENSEKTQNDINDLAKSGCPWYKPQADKTGTTVKLKNKTGNRCDVTMSMKYEPDEQRYFLTTSVEYSRVLSKKSDNSPLKKRLLKQINQRDPKMITINIDNNTNCEIEAKNLFSGMQWLTCTTVVSKEQLKKIRDELEKTE